MEPTTASPLMLDIIVPHYTEKWPVVEKFFTMLDMQRGADFSAFRVTVVHDGENCPFPEDHFSFRPYAVRELTIPHGGVSAARNKGLLEADAVWVMFCDCDDMFGNPYALRDILAVLPAQEYDMLWSEFLVEDTRTNGRFILYNRSEQNCVFCHGKIYRRQFLLDNNLFFNTELTFNEDSELNAILLTYLPHQRIGKIKTTMPLYIWCWRPDSTTHGTERAAEAVLCHYKRNKNVTEAHRKNLPYKRYCGMVARTCIDAYYALNLHRLPPELLPMRKDFKAWYQEHRQQWLDADLDTLKKAKEIARFERGFSELENTEHGADYLVDESVTVSQWLDMLEREDI